MNISKNIFVLISLTSIIAVILVIYFSKNYRITHKNVVIEEKTFIKYSSKATENLLKTKGVIPDIIHDDLLKFTSDIEGKNAKEIGLIINTNQRSDIILNALIDTQLKIDKVELLRSLYFIPEQIADTIITNFVFSPIEAENNKILEMLLTTKMHSVVCLGFLKERKVEFLNDAIVNLSISQDILDLWVGEHEFNNQEHIAWIYSNLLTASVITRDQTAINLIQEKYIEMNNTIKLAFSETQNKREARQAFYDMDVSNNFIYDNLVRELARNEYLKSNDYGLYLLSNGKEFKIFADNYMGLKNLFYQGIKNL